VVVSWVWCGVLTAFVDEHLRHDDAGTANESGGHERVLHYRHPRIPTDFLQKTLKNRQTFGGWFAAAQ
jgi:hypothetical protein